MFASHEQVTILDRAVELRLPETWVYPDVLVYAVAGGDRHLVGQWSGRPVERFPLPDGVTAVELFSLGHQRTIRRFEKATR